MRIVCTTCSTKYTIADDKLGVRSLRIPCKKCGGAVDIPARVAANDERRAGDGIGVQSITGTGVRLRGERNESSVLFSLGNLSAVATNRVPRVAFPSSEPTTDGSGLLDMRKLASTYATPAAGSDKKAAESALPVFTANGFGAAPPAVLLAPPASPTRGRNLLYALMTIIGALAIAAVMLTIVVLQRNGETSSAIADTPHAPIVEPPALEPPISAVVEVPPIDDTATPTPDETPVKPQPVVVPDDKKVKKHHRHRHRRQPLVEPPDKECGDEFDCLTHTVPKPPEHVVEPVEREPDPDLPTSLSGGDISREMANARRRAARCSALKTTKGNVKFSVQVAANGSVRWVKVTDAPTKAAGECVVKAVKQARFDHTQNGQRFSYLFPFR